MSESLDLRMPRQWLVGGMAVIIGAAVLMAVLLFAGSHDGFDGTEMILLVMLVVFTGSALEFPHRRYIFYPHRIEAWWWFRWHVVDLPGAIRIRHAHERVLVVSASDDRVLMKVTREFTRGGEVAAELVAFYRRHRRAE